MEQGFERLVLHVPRERIQDFRIKQIRILHFNKGEKMKTVRLKNIELRYLSRLIEHCGIRVSEAKEFNGLDLGELYIKVNPPTSFKGSRAVEELYERGNA